MLSIARIVKYALAICMIGSINVTAMGPMEDGLMMACNSGHHQQKKNKKTIFTANYNNWTDLTVVGSGTITQSVANITQGTKVRGNPISFSASTTEIIFSNPIITIKAREGDTIFVNAFIHLNPGSSIISSQPLTAFTSDTKNFSSPQNLTLLLPNISVDNSSSNPIDADNFSYVTVFRKS